MATISSETDGDTECATITKTVSSTSHTSGSGTGPTSSLDKPKKRASILLIGANGNIGQAIIQAGANHPEAPLIHAFVRTPEDILPPYRFLCTSIIQGCARAPYEIANAIEEVKPDHIILCVGNSSNSDNAEEDMDFDVREAAAISLVCSLNETETDTYIRVTVFSTFVMKPFDKFSTVRNNELFDQRRQEETLISSFLGCQCLSHLLIVRIKKGVIVDETKVKGNVCDFEVSNFRGRTNNKLLLLPLKAVHRQDLAQWLMNRIHGPSEKFGGIIGVSANKAFL